MEGDDGVRIGRVGFRDGTDEQLAALHAVEVPVEVERSTNRMPRQLDAYAAFARNLPSAFDDHSWLASEPDGTPVAVGYCWSHADGDPRAMTCDVLVRHDRRRRGLGTRLVAAIVEQTAAEGRSLLTWSTTDAVPAAEAFSRGVGGRPARVNRESELAVDDVDDGLLARWVAAERARERGYSLELVVGPFPEHLRGDAVRFHHVMQTAPQDELEVGEVHVDDRFVAELDRALVESGRTRWMLLVRSRDGTCVGGTELAFAGDQPDVAFQQNTGIDPAHRGLGLAKWAKAAMLERLRAERPDVRTVRTGNAFSNAPMLAVNDALGFRVVRTSTDWQADVAEVRQALRR